MEDILEELDIGMTRLPARQGSEKREAKEILPENPEEELILSLIKEEAKHIDQIVRESHLDIAQTTSIISLMEIKGKVRNLGGMVYGVNR